MSSSFRFTRRQVRQALGWSDPQVRKHLERLVDLEYLLVRHGGPGSRFVYELLWDGKGMDGGRFVMGLIDVEALKRARTAATVTPSEPTVTPSQVNRDPTLTPCLPPVDPRLTPAEIADKPIDGSICSERAGKSPRNAHQGSPEEPGSYVRPSSEGGERGKQRVGVA